jgi:hypothetical protein
LVFNKPAISKGKQNQPYNVILVGGFNPSEKYISQLGLLFPIYGKTYNVPNHQPGYEEKNDCTMLCTSADPIPYKPINILQVNRQGTKRCKSDQKRKLGRVVLKTLWNDQALLVSNFDPSRQILLPLQETS